MISDDLECPVCGARGFTKSSIALHTNLCLENQERASAKLLRPSEKRTGNPKRYAREGDGKENQQSRAAFPQSNFNEFSFHDHGISKGATATGTNFTSEKGAALKITGAKNSNAAPMEVYRSAYGSTTSNLESTVSVNDDLGGDDARSHKRMKLGLQSTCTGIMPCIHPFLNDDDNDCVTEKRSLADGLFSSETVQSLTESALDIMNDNDGRLSRIKKAREHRLLWKALRDSRSSHHYHSYGASPSSVRDVFSMSTACFSPEYDYYHIGAATSISSLIVGSCSSSWRDRVMHELHEGQAQHSPHSPPSYYSLMQRRERDKEKGELGPDQLDAASFLNNHEEEEVAEDLLYSSWQYSESVPVRLCGLAEILTTNHLSSFRPSKRGGVNSNSINSPQHEECDSDSDAIVAPLAPVPGEKQVLPQQQSSDENRSKTTRRDNHQEHGDPVPVMVNHSGVTGTAKTTSSSTGVDVNLGYDNRGTPPIHISLPKADISGFLAAVALRYDATALAAADILHIPPILPIIPPILSGNTNSMKMAATNGTKTAGPAHTISISSNNRSYSSSSSNGIIGGNARNGSSTVAIGIDDTSIGSSSSGTTTSAAPRMVAPNHDRGGNHNTLPLPATAVGAGAGAAAPPMNYYNNNLNPYPNSNPPDTSSTRPSSSAGRGPPTISSSSSSSSWEVTTQPHVVASYQQQRMGAVQNRPALVLPPASVTQLHQQQQHHQQQQQQQQQQSQGMMMPPPVVNRSSAEPPATSTKPRGTSEEEEHSQERSREDSWGRAVVVRREGSTLRDGVDIDESQVICKLAYDEVVYFDRVQVCPEIPGETVEVKRLHVYALQTPSSSTTTTTTGTGTANDDDNDATITKANAVSGTNGRRYLQGWASLTGRTLEDTNPILHILSLPSAVPMPVPVHDNYVNANQLQRQQYQQQQQRQQQQQHQQQQLYPSRQQTVTARPVAPAYASKPQTQQGVPYAPRIKAPAAPLSSSSHAAPYMCPLCCLDLSEWDLAARAFHVSNCTDFDPLLLGDEGDNHVRNTHTDAHTTDTPSYLQRSANNQRQVGPPPPPLLQQRQQASGRQLQQQPQQQQQLQQQQQQEQEVESAFGQIGRGGGGSGGYTARNTSVATQHGTSAVATPSHYSAFAAAPLPPAAVYGGTTITTTGSTQMRPGSGSGSVYGPRSVHPHQQQQLPIDTYSSNNSAANSSRNNNTSTNTSNNRNAKNTMLIRRGVSVYSLHDNYQRNGQDSSSNNSNTVVPNSRDVGQRFLPPRPSSSNTASAVPAVGISNCPLCSCVFPSELTLEQRKMHISSCSDF